MENYRILSSNNIDELQNLIEDVSNEGYKVLKFNDNGNPDNWQGIVIMERIKFIYIK
jgi:hypothetical protein